MRFKNINEQKPDQKSALLIRLGAWGDMIWASAVLAQLKKDGYHVTLNCVERGYQVVREDPNVDRFIIVNDGEFPNDGTLQIFWDALASKFDRTINLSESIEKTLLKTPGDIDPLSGEDRYNWSKERLHMLCNKNYMDQTMEWSGYKNITGAKGSLYFTQEEEAWGQKFRAKAPGFMVLWSLGGSAAHKAYPYAEYVALTLLEEFEDMHIVTVGDDWCKLLEMRHPRALNMAGQFGIRKSLLLTKVADLVVGPESSVINAASCFDVPKVLLLSHSSVENLSKYWTKTDNLASDAACYPCHKIHYTLDCPLAQGMPLCMQRLDPQRVYASIKKQYLDWKSKQILGVN
jgi:ADP-heptose:LPS heptosyltransferase